MNPPERADGTETSPSEPLRDDKSANPSTADLLSRMSRRGFVTAGGVVLAGWAAWRWLVSRSQDEGISWPLRRVLEADERVARETFRPGGRAPEFVPSRASRPRVNGMIGMTAAPGRLRPVDPDAWRVEARGGAGDVRSLSLAEIRALPRFEQVTELKCIEGWSTVVRWAGVRLSDLAAFTGLASRSHRPYNASHPPNDLYDYVSLATPDEIYYVGLDRASALHPQTLLAYELDGRPLSPAHGEPLRLVIPVKYGIKHIKQIGRISFTDRRPADYWAERGYDWYSGH